MSDNTTDHEKATMEAAYDRWLRDGGPYAEGAFAAGWKAARAYEPPAVCGERDAIGALRCVLHAGHDGDHRAPLHLGGYFGWPREQEPCDCDMPHVHSKADHPTAQEPDPDERCAYKRILRDSWPCGVPRRFHEYMETQGGHAFISAKEATK